MHAANRKACPPSNTWHCSRKQRQSYFFAESPQHNIASRTQSECSAVGFREHSARMRSTNKIYWDIPPHSCFYQGLKTRCMFFGSCWLKPQFEKVRGGLISLKLAHQAELKTLQINQPSAIRQVESTFFHKLWAVPRLGNTKIHGKKICSENDTFDHFPSGTESKPGPKLQSPPTRSHLAVPTFGLPMQLTNPRIHWLLCLLVTGKHSVHLESGFAGPELHSFASNPRIAGCIGKLKGFFNTPASSLPLQLSS